MEEEKEGTKQEEKVCNITPILSASFLSLFQKILVVPESGFWVLNHSIMTDLRRMKSSRTATFTFLDRFIGNFTFPVVNNWFSFWFSGWKFFICYYDGVGDRSVSWRGNGNWFWRRLF